MRHGNLHLLLLCLGVISARWSILLHRKILTATNSQNFPDKPIDNPSNELLQSDASTTSKQMQNQLNDHTNNNASSDSDSTVAAIETVLIIASAPYKADQVTALWTLLECVTTGIDKVLISAPDTPWSREIITAVVKKFHQLSREKSNESSILDVETAFYTNNRYDVGLWCDSLSLHLGFDGERFVPGDKDGVVDDAAAPQPRAIFLINDSSIALRQYTSLTNRMVKYSQIEQQQQLLAPNNANNNDVIKLVSLNGKLVKPGIIENYWVESVYRGLTPRAVSTFYHHSCTPKAGRACVGKRGNRKKRCIVDRFEISLANEFRPLEVDAMYPSYMPKEWDATEWTGGESISGFDHWVDGGQFFDYLHQVHDFPSRKVKWPKRRRGYPPKSMCMKLMCSDSGEFRHTLWNSFLALLPFPSAEEYGAFRKAMLESESSL